MKRVLTIQDLSCVGKCSLTVALPIFSAMGLHCSVLPTTVLSTHTGFPNPVCHPLTGEMCQMADHWLSVGAEFDGVSIGYLANPEQAAAVAEVLKKFPAFTVVDPAMGDHGKLYSGICPEQVRATAQLCRNADVLLPNLTEAALLTGLPYREKAEESYLRDLTAGLTEMGATGVVITGIHWDGSHTGFVGTHPETGWFSYKAPRIPRSLHGTGDMFAAVCTGGLLLDKPLPKAAALAAGFVEQVVDATEEITPFGGNFEQQLPWLWKQL